MPRWGKNSALLASCVLLAAIPNSTAQGPTEISSVRAPAAGPETLRIRVQLVLVPVRVESPNPGRMTVGDFRLLVNGQEQPVRIFEAETQQIDVAVILDTSASTAGDLPLLKKAAEKFVARFAPAARIAIYQTGADVKRLAGFTGDAQALRAGLKQLRPGHGPGSRLYDAIAQADAEFPAGERRRAVVIFSDAVDEKSSETFESLQRRMLRGNTPIYAIVTRERLEPSGSNAAAGRWAIVFDLAASSARNTRLLRQTGLRILEQLHPEARVMVCDFQRYLRRLRRPTVLVGDQDEMWTSPAGAREIVGSMVGTNQYARLGAADQYCNAEKVVVLTDPKRTGLKMLRRALAVERASVLAPAEHDAQRLETLLDLMVRQRAQTARFLWEQSRLGHQRMTSLSRASGGQVAVIDGIEQAGRAYDQIFAELRDSYLLGYYHSGEAGDFRLRVESPTRDLTLHSRTRVVVD